MNRVLPLLSEAARDSSAKKRFTAGVLGRSDLDSRGVPGGAFVLPALSPLSSRAYSLLRDPTGPTRHWSQSCSFLLLFPLQNKPCPFQFLISRHFPHIRRKYCWSWFLSLHHLNIPFSYFSVHLPILTGSDGFEADVFPFQIERTVVFELRIDIV